MGREVALELRRVRFVTSAGAEDDSTAANPFVVDLGALFRNTGADNAPNNVPVAPPAPAPAIAPAIGPATIKPTPGIAIDVAAASSAPRAAPTPIPVAPPMPAPSAAFEPVLNSVPGLASPKWRLRVSSDISTLTSSAL